MIFSGLKRIWALITEDRKHRAEENKVRAEEIRIITAELKYLKDYHKQEHLEQKQINEALQRQDELRQKQFEDLQQEVIKLRELEELCLEGQRIIKDKYIVTLEKLIFKTKGKHDDDEILNQ